MMKQILELMDKDMKLRFFKTRIPKYEFTIMSSCERYADVHIEELQNDGWELAGNVELKYHGSPTNAIYIYIPFKRKITSTI